MQGQHLISQLSEEISKVIKGKDEAIMMILTVLLAQGHVLIAFDCVKDYPSRIEQPAYQQKP